MRPPECEGRAAPEDEEAILLTRGEEVKKEKKEGDVGRIQYEEKFQRSAEDHMQISCIGCTILCT